MDPIYALFVVACLGGEPMEPQNCVTTPVPRFFPNRGACEEAKQRGDSSSATNLDFDIALSICVPVLNMSPPGTHMEG